MPKLTRDQFAERAGVSKMAISKAVRSGNLVESSGKIDTDRALNRDYLQADHSQKSSAGKAAPPSRGSLSAKQTEARRKLYERKLRAEVELKEEQTKRHAQARAKDLGLLIERELVDRMMTAFGVELKIRFLDMPRRLAQRITAIAAEGPRVVEALLDAEIADALAHAKEKARAAGLGNLD